MVVGVTPYGREEGKELPPRAFIMSRVFDEELKSVRQEDVLMK